MSPSDRDRYLATCSVLRRFDRDLLCDILGCDEATAESLLADPAIEPFNDSYRLHPSAVAAARDWLAAKGSQAEANVHERAFLAHLRRQQQSPNRTYEDEYVYHLDALSIPLATTYQWVALRRYAILALRTRPQRTANRRRLRLFAGVAAVYLQKYTRGDRLLSDLLKDKNTDPDVIIRAYKGLADGSWFRSRYDEALGHYEQMYAVAQAAGDRAYQGLARLNRASVFHELEQYEPAMEECEQSLALFRDLNDEVREAHALYHMALITMHLGRWDAARRYTTVAAAQFERLGMTAYLGYISWCQGLLAHIFGDEPASEAAYRRGLAIIESASGEQITLALDIRVNLGALAIATGRLDEALDHYDHAMAHATRVERQHQVHLIQFRRGQIFERLGQPGRAFLAFRQAIRGVERMGAATTREDVKISLLGTTQQIYEAMVLRCLAFYEQSGDFTWAERALNYIERARSRAFLDALAQKGATDQAPEAERRAPVQLQEIQEALSEDDLLIEYYTTGVVPRGEHLIDRVPPSNKRLREILSLPAQTVGFAISKTACVLFRTGLNPNSLRPQAGESLPGRYLLLGPTPSNLYRQLIAPVETLLRGKRLLYLIPHGPLHYVPFAALRAPGGAALIDLETGGAERGLALAQAPSASILVRACLGRQAGHGTQSLAVGFNAPQSDQPLRFAEAEAMHVARLLGGVALIGAGPKREQIRDVGPELRRLHIAGHALFTPRDPLGSWLLLGETDQLSARAIIDEIALGADLVTLSSCTSGISHVVPGDELLGLPRAMIHAGAATVVCTRWEAVDIVALLVMDRFYQGLEHHSPATALRNAQVAVRDLSAAQITRVAADWAAEGGALAEAIGDPERLLSAFALATRRPAGAAFEREFDIDPDTKPFADAAFWAPFMVIGRG